MEEEIPMVTSPTNVSGKKSIPGVSFKTCQERLLKCLEEENLSEFKKLLEHKDEYKINPDHVYDDTYKTCLAEASMKGLTEFIEALLNNGADPNFVCKFHLGQTAIHFAAKEGRTDAIRCLVEHPRTRINAIDRQGNTALHLLASNSTVDRENAEACFSYLASRMGTAVRLRNEKLQSAIKMALGKYSRDIWKDVLRCCDLRPEDRQSILDQHPEFRKDNQENSEPKYTYDDAYTDLREKNIDEFKDKFKKEFVNQKDLIVTTFLQLACREGHLDIVELLLRFGADVNDTGTHEERPPVYLACYHGQYDILESLFKIDNLHVGFVEENSLLQGVLCGLYDNGTRTEGYRKCFDYLLQKQLDKIRINHCNKYGHTAMHYAAELEDGYYTKALLEHGAYIGYLNKYGVSPLRDIGPQELEEILDNCVECKETNEDHYKLKFNFNMLNPNETCDTSEQTMDAESGERLQERLPEMGPLYFISRSKKLGHLLKHPVLLMFLHLKWTRICILFYINMIYYITFVIFLTVYVLSDAYSPEECNGKPKPNALYVILLVLSVILVVRELMQLCLLPKWWRYFCKLDNLLEVCIIASTIQILVGTCCTLLMAVTLLLAWMEVILQLGCIQRLAIYNEMMKRVTLNYLKFLCWYSPLILAFSFSFYMLHDKESSEWKNGTFYVNSTSGNFSARDDNVDFYSDLPLSLLRTPIMMIGEFDASTMSLKNGSYFVFLFFVFMMIIVLMNLLNGLAVSDTQAIKNDAELVVCRYKVQLVYHFENVVFGGPLKGRCRCHLTGGSRSLCCPWQRRLQKAISLFPDTFVKGNLNVVLNQEIRYTNTETDECNSDKEPRPDTCCTIGKYRWGLHVDREVLTAAKDIADQRKKQSRHENNQIVSRLAKVEEDLQGCMKQLANLEGLLKQLINNR